MLFENFNLKAAQEDYTLLDLLDLLALLALQMVFNWFLR